ncbi:MAG TPA: hypothetical protein VFN52_00785, partial [Acidiferrobacteraceae bacterium]|nr:hypothetical protein [Acidiferrobacteraceae bacterium]
MKHFGIRSLKQFDLKKAALPFALAIALGACVGGGGGSSAAPASSSSSSVGGGQVGPSTSLNQQITAPGVGTGQTYYVSTTGSDSNNGLSLQTPFLTLA